MPIAWVTLVVAAVLFIFGIGFTLRFFSYMVKGVRLTVVAYLQFLLFGSMGIVLGLYFTYVAFFFLAIQ